MTAFHSEANRYEQQAEHYQERIAEFEAKLEPLDRTVAELTDRMASLEQRPLEPWSHQSLISDNFGCCRSELSGLARPAAHGEAVYRRLCRTPLAAVPGRDMFAASVVDTERTKPPAQLREVGPTEGMKTGQYRSAEWLRLRR